MSDAFSQFLRRHKIEPAAPVETEHPTLGTVKMRLRKLEAELEGFLSEEEKDHAEDDK